MGEWERINSSLKEKVLRHMPETGARATDIPGLSLSRRLANDILENSLYRPCIGVMLQGRKKSTIGTEEYVYGEGQCLVVGVDVPSSFYVVDGTEEAPFLCLSLEVDRFLLTRLAAEVPPAPAPAHGSSLRGVSVEKVELPVLDAFSRLVDLLDTPAQIPMLAPMIVKEIYYRMLLGPQGEFLRRFHTLGSQSTQIAQAVMWLRDNYRSPLQVEELARRVNMATSTFHRHFKEVTSLSPLQFHKRLRLFEAQRLMLSERVDAASAGLAVGYESPTQFNREYKRLFGDPPHRNITRLKNASSGSM
ncbi:AraC family transcriptional regulator [Mailhella massiliensis]|uniref:AraC family transcriptional regulator n=1 Tax=Mailhella massiliensis TaxID=1903261 RepID=A0A921DRI1_9BACT|nr:AraC family transcriptional regulator [Mailhella massiliensis]HJD96032.1 AraC family transcriptional regulator [Mailhella massiliensis]